MRSSAHYGGTIQVHTRSSILQRLLTHEAWHEGELSQTLGIRGLRAARPLARRLDPLGQG